MRSRSLRGSLLSAFVALAVLLLGAVLMTLNPGGVTAGVRNVQQALFARTAPGITTPAPAGDLAAIPPSAFDTGVWANNAAAVWPELLFLLIAGGIVVYLLARFRPLWAGLFTLLAIAAATAGSWYLFARGQGFIEVLFPVVLLALAAALAAAAHRNAQVRSVVPTRTDASLPTAEAAAAVPQPPAIRAEARTVTYLVCQLRGMGAMGSTLDATGTMTLLESAVAPMRAAVTQLHGDIAYLSGDRLAAAWNAIAPDTDHTLHACEAGLRILNGLAHLKDQHGEGTPYDPLQLAIGIATGPAAVGSLGEGQDGWSVIGPCVEMAELLSKLSLRYGPGILVSDETRRGADATFALLEIDTIPAEPDGRPMTIYALYGNPLVRASPKFRALSTFHDHLFQAMRGQRWADARTLIGQCNNLSGAIPQLYDLHMARIEWYESHPLPADWDGAFRPPVV